MTGWQVEPGSCRLGDAGSPPQGGGGTVAASHSLLWAQHTGWVWGCAVSSDGQSIITASDDSTARVWNADGSLRHTPTGRAWVESEWTWDTRAEYLIELLNT